MVCDARAHCLSGGINQGILCESTCDAHKFIDRYAIHSYIYI